MTGRCISHDKKCTGEQAVRRGTRTLLYAKHKKKKRMDEKKRVAPGRWGEIGRGSADRRWLERSAMQESKNSCVHNPSLILLHPLIRVRKDNQGGKEESEDGERQENDVRAGGRGV